jgi:hypothetical protein
VVSPDGDHLNVYGVAPPFGVIVAAPSFPPGHVTAVVEAMETVGAARFETDAFSVFEHPLASVTITVYPPAGIPPIDAVVAVLLHKYV